MNNVAHTVVARDIRAEYVALRIEDEVSDGTEDIEIIVQRSSRIMDIAESLPKLEVDKLEMAVESHMRTHSF